MAHYEEYEPVSSILVVEDSAPLLRNLAFLLKIAGFEVITAANGVKALDALKQRVPDLIISDINMPEMDGYELLRAVRSHPVWSTTPFIFISEQYALDDLLYGLDLGADDYVPKPFDIYDILDSIRRTLPQTIVNRLKDSA